ncbi:hypothetical protein AB833_15180 [Chromatiales bacterium (ex Bugula neritina AB1)]|nr:hypothetical protein AB833_15180 [Chromatiales bacterium (ex Bugula neritina AB1)]
MSSIKNFLKGTWAASLIVVLGMSVAIWYTGPYLGFSSFRPLRPPEYRLACIAALLAGWVLYILYRLWRARKTNTTLLDSISDDGGLGEAKAAESATLQEKMEEAVSVLKTKSFSRFGGKKYIYELPWYLIIGPPGAGKTTLLQNSGLNFPLEESHGKFSVKGVGGTRNCDWWFTDEAVLLDTAGRYTTQDSDSEIDKSAWSTFLELLKKTRSRRPVNGMFVAIAFHDIVQSNEDQLRQLAKTIRIRVEEMHTKFGMRPPIYLVITKSDLMAGFNEFFANLDEDHRKQVWGFTLDPAITEDFSKLAEAELDKLRSILFQQLTIRLNQESSQQRRDQIYGFPMQFSAMQNKLRIFIEQFSSKSRLQEDPYIRGLYFTSATQEGSVLDQVVSSVAQSFGFSNEASAPGMGAGKSFFVSRLLSDVVFGEAGLAGTNLSGEKRAKRLQWVTVGMIALLTAGVLSSWGLSYFQNKSMMAGIENTAETLEQQVSRLPVDSLDLLKTSSMLNNARDLNTTRTDSGVLLKHTGLYQGEKIGRRASTKYDELLIDGLLARLMVRLEHQIHAEANNSEFLFEALKTYQMIGSKAHYNADDIIGWFKFDFDQNLPSTTSRKQLSDLIGHTENLFQEIPKRLPRPLDTEFVARYQQIAATTPLENHAYFRIKQLHSGQNNTALNLSDIVGFDLTRSLTLSNDKTFNNFIPLFYTPTGYHQSFLPSLPKITQALANDKWVLGPYADSNGTIDGPRLEQSVLNQYYTEYRAVWEELLNSLVIRKSGDLRELTAFISLVTEEDSPLKKLLVTTAEQTTLRLPQPDPNKNEAGTDRQSNLTSLIKPQGSGISDMSDPVTEYFKPLHDMVEDWESNGSKIDSILQQTSRLNIELLPMATTPGAFADPQLSRELQSKIRDLSSKSQQLPAAVASLVSEIANDVNDAASGGLCAQLNAQWESEVYPYYQRALSNRYPLRRRATSEITLDDFGRFFGPGGIIDTYVSTYLADKIQKTSGKWTWSGPGNVKCIADNTLVQLARAEEIKNTFFSPLSQLPSFSFALIPEKIKVDGEIDHLYLTIGGRTAEFFHGPLKGPSSFSWPGPGGNTEATIRVEPIFAGSASRISVNGPWGILRLLERGQLTRRSRSETVVDYKFSGRPVRIEFRSSSYNPLSSNALRAFVCPRSL